MRMQVQSLALLSGLRIWHCCELWHRPASVALTGPLARELPYAVGVALISKKEMKKIRSVVIRGVGQGEEELDKADEKIQISNYKINK